MLSRLYGRDRSPTGRVAGRGPRLRLCALALAGVALLGTAGCPGTRPTENPGTPRTTSPARGQTSRPEIAGGTLGPPRNATTVLVGAGDIGSCESDGDDQTAKLLDRIPGTVFTVGDNAYPDGTAVDYARCYEPTWGRHKARTRPAPGNHEYRAEKAAAYFKYFGPAAGPAGRGYYSYDSGGWHVVVLNSNCSMIEDGCRVGSRQERWLRADLAGHPARCTVAMWHHPPFTSGRPHGPSYSTRPLLDALYDGGVELLVTGHNHQYERFAPQTPTGGRDDARGVRAFVVGTGGAFHYTFGRPMPNSVVRNGDTYGVLKLILRPGTYEWQFVPVAGGTFTDFGRGTCH